MATDNPNDPDYETQHVIRVKFWCPVAEREALNEEIDGKGHGANNVTVPCVEVTDEDDDPPTHYASDGQWTAEDWSGIEPLLISRNCEYVVQQEGTKQVTSSNVVEADQQAGQVKSFDQLAVTCGMKRRIVGML